MSSDDNGLASVIPSEGQPPDVSTEFSSTSSCPFLKGRKLRVYFAGSIRGGRSHVRTYQKIVGLLENMGHEVLTKHVADPKLHAHTDFSIPKDVYTRDLRWLREADVVVAEVTVPSLGVGFELGMATQLNKPTLCLFHGEQGLNNLSNLIRGNELESFVVHTYDGTRSLKRIVTGFLNRPQRKT